MRNRLEIEDNLVEIVTREAEQGNMDAMKWIGEAIRMYYDRGGFYSLTTKTITYGVNHPIITISLPDRRKHLRAISIMRGLTE